MRKRYRAAIIGLGKIGSRYQEEPGRRGIVTHAAAWAGHPACTLVAGADPRPSQRAAFAKRWPETRVYADAAAMLRTEQPDIISIASPTDQHVAHLLLALRAHPKAILCEKPLAYTSRNLRTVRTALARHRVPIAVNFSRRWDAMLQAVAADLRRKRYGAIQHIDAYYTGSLSTNGSHMVDCLRLLAGEPRWAQAFPPFATSPRQGVGGLFGFASGVVAHLHHLDTDQYVFFECDCYCTGGRIRLVDHGAGARVWRTAAHARFRGMRALRNRASPYGRGYRDVLSQAASDLVACIGRARHPRCTVQDGLRALQIQDALLQSAGKKGRRVVIR